MNAAHSSLSKLKQTKVDLESEIADSDLFLKELEARMFSLEESSAAESYLGTAVFSFCPSCFSKVEPASGEATACTLCKSNIPEDAARSQLARMRNELALQLRESGTIRMEQLEELDRITRDIPAAESSLKALETEFKRNQTQWRSPDQILVQSLSREIGAKELEIKNTLELKKLADLLEKLGEKLGEAEGRLEWTKGRIDAVSREQEGRHNDAYLAVANNFKRILKMDFDRQTEFAEAANIGIDFAANRVTIDGQAHFSASSMVFARHAFHLALLLASLQKEYFRYPRLLILDGIEDGGMEPDRSYNFQRIIAISSDNSTVVHQIIMTTMSVCPELDDEKYIVGRKFTHDQKSIGLAPSIAKDGLVE